MPKVYYRRDYMTPRSFRIPDNLRERLLLASEEQQRSMTEILCEILDDHLPYRPTNNDDAIAIPSLPAGAAMINEFMKGWYDNA